MKRFKYVLILLIACPFMLWAGGSKEAPVSAEDMVQSASITIEDSLGRTIVLPGLPRRIAQAGSSAFLVNDALYLFPEASERIVAMADSSQGRGYFLPVVDKDYDKKMILPRTINIEEIMAANPDLVIMKDFLFSKYDKIFQNAGIPVIYLNLESPEAWKTDIDVLGKVFGNPDRAEELQDLFSRSIKRVEEPLANLKPEERKKSLILYYSEKDGAGAFQIPPLSFIQTSMLRMAGADPVWKDADLESRWTKTGFEQIAAWDPDQIFLISYRTPMDKVLKIMDDSPYWKELRAYREGEIYPFPTDFHSWDQPDPRWLLGVQWMAKMSHREDFQDLDMKSLSQDFFTDFFGLSKDVYQEEILPMIEGID